MSIEARVLQTISQHNMINRGDKVLAAVSGGADSVCMLSILNRLKADLRFELYCAHVNHGLRGEAADKDQKFVEELCKNLGIVFYTRTYPVDEIATQDGLSLEEAGRKVRYAFFEELSKEWGFNKIATAHNSDDNAETVLMRILRGTGVDGLGGVQYVRADGVIRPVLDVSRCEIEKYCEQNHLAFCTDATNFENNYTRNKVRNQLLPYLEKEFNPNIRSALLRLAETSSEDSAFLNGYTSRLYERLNNPLPSQKPISLHIESLGMTDRAISSRILRMAAIDAVGDVKLEKKHIEDLYELMTKETGAKIDLPKGLKASVNYGWLVFDERMGETAADLMFHTILPGETVFIESLGRDITLKIEDAKQYKCKINETALDYDSFGGQPLFLRSRRDGDRIAWFKDGKEKKIKKVFIDEKIPKKDRDKIPLLCTGSEVLAIVGSFISSKYRITKETERALVIVYGPNKG